ncbi:AB hydrolase-1 domain-containing protein [Mycena kentingensis (nom. inval.)]|nr:AB hydrolase-1 domain-containing protein [Mycena kentingensis (nom. inval.)]
MPKRSKKTPQLYFGPEPAYVVLRSHYEPISLRTLVETRCTSLKTKFRPTWWLNNGHMQTVYSVLGDFSNVDRVWYQRRLLRLVDGGTLGLDFTPPEAASVPADAPILVVQHGLTGGSHEPYVRSILAPACTPVERGGLGYRAVVINFRGCSGVPITSAKFYTGAQTDDLRQALTYISSQYPDAPLLGLGFSIGGNVLARYLAEEGANSRISAAAILGNPWDLVGNTLSLHKSIFGRHLYLPGMGDNVKRVILRHQAVFFQNPEHPTAVALRKIMHTKHPTLTEFDDIYTRTVGDTPPYPFASVHDYYSWASTHDIARAQIRVPCLTINARDDPVVQRTQMPLPHAQDGGYVVSVITHGGGHLGWFCGRGAKERWSTKPVLEWMEVFGRHVRRDPGDVVISEDEDGFLRESQWPNLGCKEISGGGIIDGNRPERELYQGF